ncbi:MAG TPA: polyprenyl synthetase family protein [Actinomycetota bacterium]|nr:polyprenyl synthetase family protein [Actinomycetota bacterium]
MARAARLRADLPLPPACVPLVNQADEELVRFLRVQRRAFDPDDAGVLLLFDELERIVASGGKRLRPLFCLLGHRAAGGAFDDRAIRAASALELLHTFAIVHDDVMDRSPTRRGRPASWVHFAEQHRAEGLRGSPEGYGTSAAVLLGDLALVLADAALLASGFGGPALSAALERYARMRTEVVAGQYLDVLAAHRGAADEREARRIAVLKSGGYTVEAPLQIGALLAGADGELLAVLSRYGVALGEAFQLRDDVLGVFGDPAVTGKDRDSDLREGKRTLLVARAAAAASPDDRRFLEDRLGAPDLSAEEIERARALLESTGALGSTLSLVGDLVDRAKGTLATADLPGEAADLLRAMADLVAVRRL